MIADLAFLGIVLEKRCAVQSGVTTPVVEYLKLLYLMVEFCLNQWAISVPGDLSTLYWVPGSKPET